MKPKCCICKCSRRDTVLHRFPVNKKRLAKWLKSLNRDDLNSLSPVQIAKLFICQKHFEQRFITSTLRLYANACPSLFTEDEILSGRASQEVGENYCPVNEHSYNRKRHYDHTYSQEPLKEIQATASNSIEFPEQSSPQCSQTSQDSEDIASSSHDPQTLPQLPPNQSTNQDSEIQATAFTSREFSEQYLPEYTQSSQDSEDIASSLCETNQKVLVETLPQVTQNLPANPDSEIQTTAFTSRDFPEQYLPEYTQSSNDSEVIASCDFQTLPQFPQNPPTRQSSQDSEVIRNNDLCETKQKVLVETLPQITLNLPANPDSEIQATAFTFRDFPEQCLPEYTQSSHDSEIQATAFTSGEFSEQYLPEYTQSSQDSEVIASSLCETKQKVLVETLPQVTQNLPVNPDSEILATALTSSEFRKQYLLQCTQSSQESEVSTPSSSDFETLLFVPQNIPTDQDSEIQVFTLTSREFPEQCLPEYTQSSHDAERVEENMINTDDQSMDEGFLFKVSDVEACRICLATDVKLFSLQDTHLGNCMKSIGGFSTSSCGGLPNFVCYECAPILLKCAKLIEKSKAAEATLLGIIAKNGLITKTLIEQEKKLQPDLQSPLDSYLLLNYYYIKYDDDTRTSEYIQAESDPHIEMEIDHSGIEIEIGANEIADQDDISVVEIEAEIPTVELDSSDGESNEEYISLVPHRTNEKLEKCANGISSKFQRKPRWTRQRKQIRLYKLEEFQDIPQHFTTVKIPVNEQKQAWRENMVMKCIETGREFICSVCQRTFQTEDSLNAHSHNHSSNPGGVRCDVCLVGFPDEAALWYHTERTHAYRFNCKHCRMVLNNIDDAKYHKKFACNGSGIKRSRRQPIPTNDGN